MAWRCVVVLFWVPGRPGHAHVAATCSSRPLGPLPSHPLPSRAPGEHPLRKVTAQGQPGAGVVVKALDRQGRRLRMDGWTDGRMHGQAGGLGAPSSLGHSCVLGPGTAHAPQSLAVRQRLVLRAEQRLGLLLPGVVGAGQGTTARGEAGGGRRGHDTRLQPHDQGVVGERRGACR